LNVAKDEKLTLGINELQTLMIRLCNRYCNGNRKVTLCLSTDVITIADTVSSNSRLL